MSELTASQSTANKEPKKLFSTKTKAIIFLSIPAIFLLAGVLVASVAAVLSLILVIVAIAVTVGIIIAAIRIHRHKHLTTDEKKLWRYQTYPWLSLILIVASVLFLSITYRQY